MANRLAHVATTLLISTAVLATSPIAFAGAAEPDYGDNRGPAPKDGHGTEGQSYRKNTYGQVGTGAVLPGSLAGSTVTTPEGLMNSGSYGVPAPGSGLDVLHQDEMKRLREHRAHKKAVQKAAKAGKAGHDKDEKTSATAEGHGHGSAPHIHLSPAELTSPANAHGVPAAAARRSVVRDHAAAAAPATPGQGGARRERSTPSTSATPYLPAYSEKAGEQSVTPKANVAGVAWGRPAQK